MKISRDEREGIARRIELALKRAAGGVRDRIIAGDTFEEAAEKMQFWTDAIEREAAKLRT